MNRKLSNQFLSNYLVVFLMTVTVTALAIVLLSLASGLISKALVKNKYPASSVMRDDYTQIDSAPIVHDGGGVQIIDKNYRVIRSEGVDNIGKSQLSAAEFTDFLVQSKRAGTPYHYDILYDPQGEFWLIVTFPTSLRIDFSVVTNKDAASGDIAMASDVVAAVFFVYLLLLAAVTFVFSRITASGITKPLRKLCDATRLLREGDYSVRIDLRLNNEFAELQATFNDMAAKIEHEMALRKKSENDRRRLILDISHDLKNPLASVSGYAELCLKKPEPPTDVRNTYLQVILRNSQRANVLLSELFELSKLDSPEFVIKSDRTDLCEYVRQACGDLLPSLESAGFRYTFDIPEKSIWVMLDHDKFSRVFQNLADNAIRYNPKGTTVSVSMSGQGDQAVILFLDNGCGIPNHLADDIFKPFVRADDSRNSDTGGSGLGLSIAKKIAQAHGGDLTLRTDIDEGCEFMITLPIIQSDVDLR